jgi:hypothetical protein
MKIYIIVLFVLVSLFSYSQDRIEGFSEGVNSFVSADVRPNGAGIMVSGEVDPGIDGDPYLFNNWNTLATIHVAGGKKFTISNLNYDTKLGRFVSKVTLDSVFVFELSNLKEASFNKTKFKRYQVNNSSEYYEVIASSKGREILKKNIKKVKKFRKDPLTGKKNKDKYILEATYFLNSKKGIHEFKMKKKSFLKIFGNLSPKVKKYMKRNKLSIKKDTDIYKIFKYYDGL